MKTRQANKQKQEIKIEKESAEIEDDPISKSSSDDDSVVDSDSGNESESKASKIDSESESDSDEDDCDEDGNDVAAILFKGENRQNDEEETEEIGDDKLNSEITGTPSSEPFTFDLRNMLAFNTEQLAAPLLYRNNPNTEKSKAKSSKTTTHSVTKCEEEIPLDSNSIGRGLLIDINEDYLLSKATSGCTELIQALWKLPTEQSDAGPLVTLPTYDEVRLPRSLVSDFVTFHCSLDSDIMKNTYLQHLLSPFEKKKMKPRLIFLYFSFTFILPSQKPPPLPKQETKWEKFAKAKGISLNDSKRSRKVWDEATGSWMFRHGYEKANKKDNEWPIMEVGANDNPYDDPWEKLREDKREKVEKNVANRMRNEERAGNINKGATNRQMKGRQQAIAAGKEGGKKDSSSSSLSLPTGLPVDLLNTNNPSQTNNKMRGKKSTLDALTAVQRSTASLGKFDQMREGEPERKKTLTKVKKRKFEDPTDKKVAMTEGQSSMKILNSVMNNGGVAKVKAIRNGQFAKGETAYDYEFNDGLGASTFRKKKGTFCNTKNKQLTASDAYYCNHRFLSFETCLS